MGCSSEKSVPINIIEKNQDLGNSELDIDLHDIEKQGEGKHPKIEEKNDEKIEKEVDDYYNYNFNDLISVNSSKMKVKRIENFDDEDDSDDESENSKENIKENNIDENKNNIINEVDENKENMSDNTENEENKLEVKIQKEDKKPEDKKPPNIQKLKKKGKEKIEINLFN